MRAASRILRVDGVRGVTVTKQTVLAVSLEVIVFKEKVEHILDDYLNGMPPEARPACAALFSWIYVKIKASRGMQRVIDEIKDPKLQHVIFLMVMGAIFRLLS